MQKLLPSTVKMQKVEKCREYLVPAKSVYPDKKCRVSRILSFKNCYPYLIWIKNGKDRVAWITSCKLPKFKTSYSWPSAILWLCMDWT